jgi:hypothetical protein
MGRLKEGVDVIEKSQLKGCERTIYQMVIKRESCIKIAESCINNGRRVETIAQGRYASFRNLI